MLLFTFYKYFVGNAKSFNLPLVVHGCKRACKLLIIAVLFLLNTSYPGWLGRQGFFKVYAIREDVKMRGML